MIVTPPTLQAAELHLHCVLTLARAGRALPEASAVPALGLVLAAVNVAPELVRLPGLPRRVVDGCPVEPDETVLARHVRQADPAALK